MVQTNPEVWQPHDDEEHPNEAPGTGQPRAEVGASFGLLRGRRLPRRELASEWIDAGVPKWVTLIDEALFVLASAMMVGGSLDFFPGVSAVRYLEGCQLYVVGSTIYLLLALFAAHEVLEDARLNRTPVPPAAMVEQALYVTGSILFLAGTVLFTPDVPLSAAPTPGTVNFPLGSFGTLLWGQQYYITGGALPSPPDSSLFLGDELFVLGSILFSVAAFISALLAVSEEASTPLRREVSVAVASLYELGGVSFVVACLGFVPASTLGISACPEGASNLHYGGAALFLGGSCLYLAGSMLILGYRAYTTYRCGDADSGVEQGRGGEA